MSRSLRVSPNHIEKVKFAVKRNGYPSQNAFAIEVGLSRVTVASFLNGKPVDFLNFTEICEKLGLDWQEVVHIEYESESEPSASVASDKKQQPASKEKLLVKFTIPMDEFDDRQLQSIIELLKQIPGNSSMTIEKVEKE